MQCQMCDESFYRRFGEQDIGKREYQFCSRDCYQGWRLEHASDSVYRKVGARHMHRIVAMAHLGRKLLPEEVVHHIDNDRRNNSPENLAVLPNQAYHARVHFGGASVDPYRLVR